MSEMAFMTKMRGLAAGKRVLRASDLVPGRLYWSPAGNKCMLLEPAASGIGRNSYLFAYLTRSGKASEDEGFALSACNARAIAAMREVTP